MKEIIKQVDQYLKDAIRLHDKYDINSDGMGVIEIAKLLQKEKEAINERERYYIL